MEQRLDGSRSVPIVLLACIVCTSATLALYVRAAAKPPAVTERLASANVTYSYAVAATERPSHRLAAVSAIRAVRRTSPTAQRKESAAARTALIVGINDDDPAHPAMGADTDAHYMRDALLMHGFAPRDVVVLLNGEATRWRILEELNRLAERTKPGGLAVVAISTHASGTSMRAGDGARLYASEIAAPLGRIRGRVWTALAACYAGRFALPGVTGRDRIATLSSDANSLTYEMGSTGSEFFYYMIDLAFDHHAADRSIENAFEYASLQMKKMGSPPPVMYDGTSGSTRLG